MVVALGPGKFYGSSLPRPRIYTDVKFNSYRVDPPVSVTDPLMSWAEEAHWSMGGLSFNRHRLQGRIEGDVEKLRTQIEKSFQEKESLSPMKKKKIVLKRVQDSGGSNNNNGSSRKKEKKEKKKRGVEESESPEVPPAPIANKRKRRYLGLVDEEEDEGVNVNGVEGVKKWPVRKLYDEFELVADGKKSVESGIDAVAARTRGGRKAVREEGVKSGLKGKKRLRKVGEVSNGGGSGGGLVRVSPRLAK